MAAEGPILTSIIARLADPEINLAAYGVSANIAMLVESPIIMMLSTSIALIRDRDSLIKMRYFTTILNICVTLLMAVLLIPQVFSIASINIIQLPQNVAELTYIGLAIMVFWPASIGYRRLYQGMLIRNGQTRVVAFGTIVRMTMMAGTGIMLSKLFHAPGIVVGTGGLAVGVLCESIAIRLLARNAVKAISNRTFKEEKSTTAIL